ncbi:TPA: hypothetical protein JBE16_08755 [Legionella pneumophila subsp. pneumophila]|nr:hypothetical protein [Legionella pneumophila]HAT8859283.1 hypothetical protein [Legionella pneumophila subsp. pneumophila]HAT9650897.1 hypothetical protein [Legionella pneumophila subsp. pneumophila]HAT9920289.1 hypothetical protein [Legionella pneumophila subsp. pneumophila]
MKKQVQAIAIKQNLDMRQHDMNSKIMITLFSLFAELECDLISLRNKEALASKKMQGIQLGKPNGTIQKSNLISCTDFKAYFDLPPTSSRVRNLNSGLMW